jgi:hypothetical protein
MKKIILPTTLLLGCFLSLKVNSQTMVQNWLTQSNNAAITNSDDRPYVTHVDKNEMVAIAGVANSQVVVSTYDAYGNDLWVNKHNGYSSDYPIGLEKDNGGNYYAGYFWGGTIRKINSSGITQWTAGAAIYFGYTFALDTATGSTYLAGSDYAQTTITLVKFAANGTTMWSQNYTGFYGQGGVPVKITLDAGGNLLLASNTKDVSGNTFLSVAKFDNGGNFVWHNASTAVKGAVKDFVVDKTTGASFVTGYIDNGTQYNMITYKSGPAGAILWNNTFHDATINGYDVGYSLALDNASNIYVVLASEGTGKQYTIRKYAGNGSFITSESVPYNNYNPGPYYNPKIMIRPTKNQLFLMATVYTTPIDNMMALYKSNLTLSGLSQIYTYNQGPTENDYAVDIDIAPLSGQIIFTGNTYTPVNGNDFFYSKVDTSGFLIYNNNYNGIIDGVDYVSSIKTDASNFAAVAGGTKSTLTNLDGFMVKYDAAGNEQWQAVFNGTDSLNDYFAALEVNASGHYYASGYTTKKINSFTSHRDMWVVKTDANGSKLWEITQQGSQTNGDDEIKDSYTNSANEGFGVGYQTNVGSGKDAVIFKYNSSGTVLWSKKYTSAGSVTECYQTISSKLSSPIYAAGFTTKSNGERDMLLAKYDNAGNLQWTRTYNSAQSGNDTAIAVTTDANNNVCVVGRSDSAKAITLKYDAAGNLLWANSEPLYKTVGPGITTTPSGQVVIVCEKDSGYYNFQTIICYNASGQTQWTKRYNLSCCESPMKIRTTSHGTILVAIDYYQYIGVIELDTLGKEKNNVVSVSGAVNSDGGTRAMAIDNNVDVYVTGYFSLGIGGSDIFTQKVCYTPAPVAVSGNTSVCYGATGIMYGVPTNTTVTNYNWTNPSGSTASVSTNSISVNFGTASSGYVTVQQTNYCGVGIADSLFVNVLPLPVVNAGADQLVCPGSSVTLSGSGAQTYLWNNGITNNMSFSATTSQNYVLIGTDANGCKNTDTVMLSLQQPPTPAICMVTVDSLSTHNILLWDKTGLSGVSGFNIYREDITNNYGLIGSVPYDSLSQYNDLDPVANPNVTTKRYKISAIDTCGNEGSKSGFHNTIYDSNNNGTFTWNTYTIQGQPNPVAYYALSRDDNNTGAWHQIATTAGTQNVMTDTSYTSYQFTANWRIETIWSISCSPTLRQGNNSTQGAIVKSKSNICNNRTTGIQKTESSFSVYPNPTNGNLTINFDNSIKGNVIVKIVSVLGEEVYNQTNIQSTEKLNVDLSKYENGVYLVQITTNNNTVIKRIVKN